MRSDAPRPPSPNSWPPNSGPPTAGAGSRGVMTIAIVGVGETDYSWKDPRPVAALALDATRRALDDAGLTGADVDGFVIEAMSLGEKAPPDQLAHHLGARNRTFSAQLGIAGSGTVGAPIVAELAIEAGLADVVVSYYGINLSARGAGGAYAYHAGDAAKATFEMPFGYYGQAVYFAGRGGALPARVRPHQRAARRRGDGGAPARRAHAQRPATRAAVAGGLPRQPARRRPAPQARLLPGERRRGRLRDDEPGAGPPPAPRLPWWWPAPASGRSR